MSKSDTTADTVLQLWTIYARPSDYPDRFVARRYDVLRGHSEPVRTDVVVTASSLDEVRDMLPPGLCRMPRSPGDDPVIVETWL